jgi:hypothetical protein
MQVELVCLAQFVARVHLLLENSRIPSEKHAEYCRAEYEPEYNHTNQNVAHPGSPSLGHPDLPLRLDPVDDQLPDFLFGRGS